MRLANRQYQCRLDHLTAIIGRSLPYVAISSLLVLTLVLFFPVSFKSASAEEITRLASTTVSTYIHSAVSVALNNRVDVEITPRSTGSFKAETTNVTVATNNVTGYAIYLKTASDNAALVNQNIPDAKITPLLAPATANDFADNTWGYNFSQTDLSPTSEFQAVPTSESLLTKTDSSSNQETYNLSFGTRVNLNLPAGEYTNSVTLSVVANPMQVTSLTQLTYMQDMTSDICQLSPDGATKQLIDNRDGRSYWVAKMKDGNCWMNQDLKLTFNSFDSTGVRAVTTNGTAGAIIGKENTDTTTNSAQYFAPTYNTVTRKTYAVSDNLAYRSWNLGEYVLATPLEHNLCKSPTAVNNSDSIAAGANLNACTHTGYVDVSDHTKWSPTGIAQFGTWNGEAAFVTVFPNNPNDLNQGGTYDAHYLTGNYYQFNLITAGSASDRVNGDTPSTLCPKGWTLPSANHANSGSYQYLVQQYLPNGFSSSAITGSDDALAGSKLWDLNSDPPIYNLFAAPLYFNKSGDVEEEAGFAAYVGIQPYVWTKTRGASSTLAYAFAASYNQYQTLNNSARYRGYTARCLAK